MNALLTAVYVVVGAAILVAVVWSFFVRRHGESELPAEDWERTEEVFVDPTTERRMRVWVDGAGERHYVPER